MTSLHTTFPSGPGQDAPLRSRHFSNQLHCLTNDNPILPIGPVNSGDWLDQFRRFSYLTVRAQNDPLLQENKQPRSVSHQQYQEVVTMTPAVTTLLLIITVVPLASYSPPVKLLLADTRAAQPRGRT